MSKKVLFLNFTNPEVVDYYQNIQTGFHKGDSGVDLYTPCDHDFLPGETKLIDLGIKAEVRKYSEYGGEFNNLSYYLYPRSSISKTPLRMANSVGIIDAGYRGNLMAAITYIPSYDDLQRILEVGTLDNYPPYTLKKGTRLFQICSNDLTSFDNIGVLDELSDSSRGVNGLGSTGV
jgi:dUTP pyrophosphatase